MIHRIFNASNVLGGIAFLAMIAATGAADRLLLAIALTGIFAGCTYLSIREDGKNK